MKKITLLFVLLLLFVRPAPGQVSQSMSFDDGVGTPNSGTYGQNATFTLSVYLTHAGYINPDYYLWLETETLNNFASSLSITQVINEFPYPTPIQVTPNPAPFDSSSGASSGFLADSRNLGGALSLGTHGSDPGTYLVAHITFTIAGAQPGFYMLQTTTLDPKISRTMAHSDPGQFFIPAAHYGITVVPEPGTLALIGLGAVGLVALRRWKR